MHTSAIKTAERLVPVALLTLLVSANSFASDHFSPNIDNDYPQIPLWGDTHLHTRLSADAIAFGTISSPDDAYQLATGGEITIKGGQRVKLTRPMDFLVVADHAEGYGMLAEAIDGNPLILTDPQTKRWAELIDRGENEQAAMEMIRAQATGNISESLKGSPSMDFSSWKNIKNSVQSLTLSYLINSAWKDALAAADRWYQPGTFTPLLGFEWTSMIQGNNLHRVVIFRDDADLVGEINPLNSNASGMDPKGLWQWLEQYQRDSGGQVLAIPHNANLSNGMMFAMTEQDGSPLSADYANRRARWEPLTEVTQIKGDGEAHPYLSTHDEFADFETWDLGNLPGSEAKTQAMLQGEYAREALKNGLKIEQQLGVNPFKFGMLGATDSHTAVTASEENNYWGKHADSQPNPNRWKKSEKAIARQDGWQYSASGLAAVWAQKNDRESIFDAMKRREVYATTGTRITLRMFAGWDFQAQDLNSRPLAKIGYAKGVPMGGDLSGSDGRPASFLISARMDPLGATLDQIQVVKGWVDSSGQSHEKIYPVAWSKHSSNGTRTLNSDGVLPPVGNSVDVATATWSNEIGSPNLAVVWSDPDFDPAQRAFYYSRVLEIPTPRWTAYDAMRFSVTMDEDVPMTLQERAYSSPIWYTP